MKIKDVQEELKQLGFYQGAIDGSWGPKTMDAFLSLQVKRGLKIPKGLQLAANDLWVKETAGPRTTARIQEYHNHTTLKATQDEIAWCSAAMNCWIEEGGQRGTGSAAARSWLGWGDSTHIPQFGFIAVLRRGNSSWEGHVTWYLCGDHNSFLGLGGNQSNSVCVAEYPVSQVLGYQYGAH